MKSMEFSLIFFMGVDVCYVMSSLPTAKETNKSSDAAYVKADKYLSDYGYYPSHHQQLGLGSNTRVRNYSHAERTMALKRLQQFYHLPQSGQLDKETTELMHRPRCGNPDIGPNSNPLEIRADLDVDEEDDVPATRRENQDRSRNESGINEDKKTRGFDMSETKRVKRYALKTIPRTMELVKWNDTIKTLTWRLSKPSRQHHVDTQREIIKKAIDAWQGRLPFKIEETLDEKAAIDIQFVKRKHGHGHLINLAKGDPVFIPDSDFDGRFGVLAHAFYPYGDPYTISGDIHIDEDENWSVKHELLICLTHEIGHTFGMDHSVLVDAVMHLPYNENMTALTQDDIDGLMELYHGVTTPQPITTTSRTTRQFHAPRDRPTQRSRTRDRPSQRSRTRDRTIERPDTRDRSTPRSRTTRKFPGSSEHTAESQCIARLKGVDAVFKDPFTKFAKLYFVISGDRIDMLTDQGTVVRNRSLKCFFPHAPSNPDTVISDSTKSSVSFIKDNLLFQYNNYKLSRYERINRDHLPETPKFSFTVENGGGRRNSKTHMFGERFWWSYVEGTKPVSKRVSDFNEIVSRGGIKFAVQWTDGLVYAVKRDDSYITLDTRGRTVQSRIRRGNPPWLKRLCNVKKAGAHRMQNNQSSCACRTRIGFSRSSLLPVFTLGFIIHFMKKV